MTTHNFKIFLVDDDLFQLAVLQKVVEGLGYSDIHSFTNGTDCLDSIHLNPDIVFLDHHMDDISGYEVLLKIKRHDPDILVVMVSGQDAIKTAVDSLKKGAFDYIEKNDKQEESIARVFEKVILLREEQEKSGLLKKLFKGF